MRASTTLVPDDCLRNILAAKKIDMFMKQTREKQLVKFVLIV